MRRKRVPCQQIKSLESMITQELKLLASIMIPYNISQKQYCSLHCCGFFLIDELECSSENWCRYWCWWLWGQWNAWAAFSLMHWWAGNQGWCDVMRYFLFLWQICCWYSRLMINCKQNDDWWFQKVFSPSPPPQAEGASCSPLDHQDPRSS